MNRYLPSLKGSPLFLSLTVVLLCNGCVKHVTATCQPQAPSIVGFDAIQTQGLGFLNVSGDFVGEVFELDPQGKNQFYANRVDVLQYSNAAPNNEYAEGNPQDSTVQVSTSWKLSGDVTGTGGQAATIQAGLNNSLTFNVTDGIRAGIRNPLTTLSDPLNAGAKGQIVGHPSLVYMILNPVELGDKVNLTVSNNDSVSATVKLGWNVSADVSYVCNANESIGAIPNGPKATIVVYPEFVQADATGAINYVGGSLNSHLFAARLAAPNRSPSPAARQKTKMTIVLCKRSGNDVANFPGCKNE